MKTSSTPFGAVSASVFPKVDLLDRTLHESRLDRFFDGTYR
jgi:hypothetical protein